MAVAALGSSAAQDPAQGSTLPTISKGGTFHPTPLPPLSLRLPFTTTIIVAVSLLQCCRFPRQTFRSLTVYPYIRLSRRLSNNLSTLSRRVPCIQDLHCQLSRLLRPPVSLSCKIWNDAANVGSELHTHYTLLLEARLLLATKI